MPTDAADVSSWWETGSEWRAVNPAIRVLVWDSLVYLIPLSVKWDPLSSSTVSAKSTRCCCRWDPHLALSPIAPRRRLMREVLVDTLAGECGFVVSSAGYWRTRRCPSHLHSGRKPDRVLLRDTELVELACGAPKVN
jgi:hypothetical protein